MIRPTLNDYYLKIALEVSTRSTCLKKHYGAVIVKNGEIISTGYNNPPRGEAHCTTCTKCDHGKDMATFASCPAVHAEMNAIISAARQEMLGSTLYLAGWDVSNNCENNAVRPCEICLRLIKNAGIDQVITTNGVIFERDQDGILYEK